MKLRVKIPKEKRLSWLMAILGVVSLVQLFTYKLGTLTGSGISLKELDTSNKIIGWHGIYHDPMFGALNFLRSIVFSLDPDFNSYLLRISNVFVGAIACIAFYYVVKSWHGAKIAFLSVLLFATSAFTLHVSRLASNDVMYFAALPMLFSGYLALRKYPASKLALLYNVIIWVSLLYTPGMIWFVLISLYYQKDVLKRAFKTLSLAWKTFYGLLTILALGLLKFLANSTDSMMTYIGLPATYGAPLEMLKDLAAVPMHLFVRGPKYPDLWLQRAPILDIFSLSMCILGIYFYLTHRSASRAKALLLYGLIGTVLIALGGPVSIALLVPLLYLFIATGITYMRQQWLHVFPTNPIARTFGTSLIIAAVVLSCVYNLRSYFIAWPHNEATHSAFSYHR